MTLNEFKTFMLLDDWNYRFTDYGAEVDEGFIATKTHRWRKDKDYLEWYDDGLFEANRVQAEIVYESPSGLTRPGMSTSISILFMSTSISILFTSFQEAYDHITRGDR